MITQREADVLEAAERLGFVSIDTISERLDLPGWAVATSLDSLAQKGHLSSMPRKGWPGDAIYWLNRK